MNTKLRAYFNMVEMVEVSKEIKVDMTNNEDGTFKAVVTMVTTENGEESTTYETFKGTESEVKASIDNLKRES